MKLYICLFAIVTIALANEVNYEELLYDGNDQFTAKILTEVIKRNKGKSVVLSAFSVLQPLAQLALGSVGASHDEILNTIGLPNDNVTKIVFPLVENKLRSVKGVILKTANRIYIPIGWELNEDFADISRAVFGSTIKNVNFQESSKTSTEINTWVEDQTNHKIKNLISPSAIGSDTRAVLVNAVYFKGTWKDQFNERFTLDRDFHLSKDTTIKVPTMYKKASYNYGESKELNAKLLELPYEGDESSFLIVLPNEIEGLNALEEKLKNPAVLHEAVKQMYDVNVNVYLPKFKIETTTNLKEVLREVGVKKLFGPEARLNKILKGENELFISDAIQKAFIEINEEGAEAAAANAFIVAISASLPEFEYVFRADRPFYYELRVNKKPLFNGVYRT